MAAKDKSRKDKEMAADLRQRGIFHGMHMTKTNAPPIPNMKDIGTAKYRRYLESIRNKHIKVSEG